MFEKSKFFGIEVDSGTEVKIENKTAMASYEGDRDMHGRCEWDTCASVSAPHTALRRRSWSSIGHCIEHREKERNKKPQTMAAAAGGGWRIAAGGRRPATGALHCAGTHPRFSPRDRHRKRNLNVAAGSHFEKVPGKTMSHRTREARRMLASPPTMIGLSRAQH
ncbi:hypothetical protein EVAR_36906_1 [Eumeta japonica]|uniref:Uncharacterized protein n=1 Tax=Eumeta variegata TaxID=151549 RepID=A0A4C1WSS3_EUMVA|nr:hypothetical protein EVAR_36906_1 [Eumeta japonica]